MKLQTRASQPIHTICCFLPLLLLLPMVATAGEVKLVLTTSKKAPMTAMQDWARELGAAGIRNVRIHSQATSAQPAQPTIETRVIAGQKQYIAKGTIDGDGQINLPGSRFQSGEAKRLAQWLDDIAENGPLAEREPTDRFGLTESNMKEVALDLSIPVTSKTDGSSRAAVIQQIDKATRFTILIPQTMLATLDKDQAPEDLKGFASGTVLAYLIEPFGLGLFPGKDKSGKIIYQIVERSSRNLEPWPIGWKPKRRNRTLPKLFQTRNVNVERIPIAQVVEVIAKQLDVPVLIDRAALARARIDMEKVTVSFPNKRVNYDRALANMLSKAKLKYQLRIDDASHPFLWITTSAKGNRN